MTQILHGHSFKGEVTKTYYIWQSMKQRCLNPNNKNYKRYGGRNIKVCDRWKHSFQNFLNDMGEKPEGLTLDRINNDDGYKPENCKWSTVNEQQYNNKDVKCAWIKRDQKWRAQITVNNKKIALGDFDTQEEAKIAYLEAKENYHVSNKCQLPAYIKRLHKIWKKMSI